ncbi:MAG: hypothetical protein ABIF77_02380 [bacterium]
MTIPTEPGSEATLTQIEDYRRRLQDLGSQRLAALGAAISRVKTRRMLGELAGPAVGKLETVADMGLKPSQYDRPARRRKRTAPVDAGIDRKAVQASLDRKLARLDPEVGPDQRSDIDELVQRLAGAKTQGQADLLLLEMIKRVGDANAVAETVREHRAQARLLLDRMAALEAPEVDRARRSLQDVEAGRRPLTDQHRDAVERAIKVGESRYADLVLREALDELGYQVEDSFDTLFLDGGTLHFTRPGWKEYSVRLRVSPTDASLNYNVVRMDQAGTETSHEQALRDKEMEETWCSEAPALQKTLEWSGLKCWTMRRVEPGELRMQLRRPTSAQRRDDRRRDEQAPIQKERDL